MMQHLALAMKQGELPPIDRVGLISDAASLCRAGRLSPALYIELLGTCEAERDPVVLTQALSRVAGLCHLLGTTSELGARFTGFARSVVSAQLDTLGWVAQPTDGHLTRQLRASVLELLPRFCANDATVCAEARRRFDAFVADPQSPAAAAELPAELRAPVFRLVLASGGEATFEVLLRLYSETLELAVEKNRALAALGAAPTSALRRRALELTLQDAVKAQDIAIIPGSVHGASDEGLVEASDSMFVHVCSNSG